MKKAIFLFAGLLLGSLNLLAKEHTIGDLQAFETKQAVLGIFDQLEQQGEFAATDQKTLESAKDVAVTIAQDPRLFEEFKNGDLALDELVSDLFLKDTVGNILDTLSSIKDAAVSAIKVIMNPLKPIAAKVASITDKVLTAVTNSDALMYIIGFTAGVLAKVIPVATVALGAAMYTTSITPLAPIAVPLGSALVSAGVTAGPVIAAVVTPSNVQEALKLAQAVASLANQFLNKESKEVASASRAPASSRKGLATSKQLGENAKMVFKGGDNLQRYIQKLGKKGWENLSARDRRVLVMAINKTNGVLSLVDFDKLGIK